MSRFDAQALAERSAALETQAPQEIVRVALETYTPKVAISTAFGVEGCAMIHMALQFDPKVSVFTVDTGYLFEETQQLKRRFVELYDLQIETFESQRSVAEQDAEFGANLHARNSDQCCAMRKVEPTQRAVAGLDGWLAALRRDQGASRRNTQILELLEKPDGTPIVKVHPFANWSRDQVWRYVLENNVPYNPLLDRGFKSVGCQPCTRAVGAGESERAGRWSGDKQECGIHTFMLRVPQKARKIG